MGRTRIELTSSGDIDMYDDVSCALTFAVADIRNPERRDSSFSKTIKVPATKGNNIRFGNIFDLNVKNSTYNVNRKASCTLYVDDVPQINGFLQLLGIEINDKGDMVYNVSVKGNVNNIFQTLGDDLLSDLDLSEFDHTYGVAEQYASWYNDYTAGYCYPLIDYGFDNDYNQYEVESLFPAIYLRTYIDKIFSNAGFTYSSTFFDSTMFKHLIIPCTGENFKLSDTQITPILFEASRSTQQTITNNQGKPLFAQDLIYPNQLSFNTDVNDPSNAFNTSTGKWSPPSNNYYNVFADCNLASTGSALGSIVTWIAIRKYDTVGLVYSVIGSSGYSIDGTTSVRKVSANNVLLKTTDVIDVVIWSNLPIGAPSDGSWLFNASNSRFYNSIPNVTLQESDTVAMNIAIPKKIKQKDLLRDVCKMFNLYIETDKDNSNKLLIETRNDFYSSGTTIDWTYKLDNSKPLELLPMGDLDFKTFKYSYTEDKDFYNAKYKDSYGYGYGDREVVIDNDFLTATNETKVMFSATPLVGVVGTDRIIPQIMTYDKTNKSSFQPYNLRILYNGGVKTTNVTWQHGGTIPANVVMRNEYLYAGHLDSVTAPTIDLNFAVPREIYYDATTYTNANIYNLYHKKFIDEISDIDSKVVTGYFYLTPYDIAKLDFRNKFYFEGQYFRLNKIYDYNPISEGVTKCEFLKIKEGVNFTGALAVVLGGYTEGFLTANDVNDFKPTTRPYVVPLPVIDNGDANVIGNTIRNSYIGGSNNYVNGGTNIHLINSSGCIVYDGLENVTLINSSGTIVTESNVLYVNGYQITSGTIASMSSSWQSIPYNATNYTCSVGTWTVDSGDVYENKYILIGKTLTWSCTINFSATSNDNTWYKIVIPSGYTAKGVNSCPISVVASGAVVYSDAYVFTATGNNYITIGRFLSSTMVASAGNMAVIFTITFEIE